MLSKATIKFIRSLELKKNRRAEGLFVGEGPKVVGDLLPHFRPRLIVATPQWMAMRGEGLRRCDAEIIPVTPDELAKASFLKTPQDVLAVFEKEPVDLSASGHVDLNETLTLVLDDVQDPGNLGTIIRIADWFGIRNLVCSPGTADAFSPKVVQATMGAIARVEVRYAELTSFLAGIPAETPVYGTFLEGENIYQHPLTEDGLIVMGSEGHGISPDVARFVTDKLFIPPYPAEGETSESLNVAVATAITCAEFRRRLSSNP